MSNINELILYEQDSKFDERIKYIQQQHTHLSQLYPIHKENLKNSKNEDKDKKKEKKEPKIVQLPTRTDLKMANHIDKVAKRVLNFNNSYF